MARRIGFTTLLVGLVVTGTLVRAAELRTTVNDRPVARTVSHTQPSAQKVSPVPLGESGAYPVWDDSCSACGVSGCGLDCIRPAGMWADVEYLLWWRRGSRVPPLATTSPENTPLSQAGVLGFNDTSVLFGGQKLGEEARPGGRVSVGMWLDRSASHAVEGRFWALGEERVNFRSESDGSLPILARPFNNQDPQAGPVGPTSRVLAFPNIASDGRIDVAGRSDVLGADVLFRRVLCTSPRWDLDLLAGYQLARIDEELIISDSLIDRDPNNLIPDGTRQEIVDRFETRNEFHAGQLGIEATYLRSCWRLELLAKVAFGNMNQVVTINGQTTNTLPSDPDSPTVVPGGLLANAGNQGRHERDEFAVAPEVGATFVYTVNDCIDFSAGYTYIFFSDVLQPGEHIDQNLAVPSSFEFDDGSFWLHGLRLGTEVRF